MKKWFAYLFAAVFFFAGVAAGLGRGQIEINKTAAQDQATVNAVQSQAVAAGETQFWAGAYMMCMAFAENSFGFDPYSASPLCNSSIADGYSAGAQTLPYFNTGYSDPTAK